MDPARITLVVTVTDLRRHASRVIDHATGSGEAVIITQYGHAEAVLLSRARYDDLRYKASQATRAAPGRATPAEAISRANGDASGEADRDASEGADDDGADAGVFGSGRRRRGTAGRASGLPPVDSWARPRYEPPVQMSWGPCDAELARFLIEEGFESPPESPPES